MPSSAASTRTANHGLGSRPRTYTRAREASLGGRHEQVNHLGRRRLPAGPALPHAGWVPGHRRAACRTSQRLAAHRHCHAAAHGARWAHHAWAAQGDPLHTWRPTGGGGHRAASRARGAPADGPAEDAWHESHEEAHGVEHVMTPNIEARLLEALGNPTTCPHGNPIPGLGSLAPDEFPLDAAHSGDQLLIQRITEEAEEDPLLMKYLQDHGVGPGAHVTVREATEFNATVVLEGPQGPVSLGFGVAAKLRARRL